VKGEQSRAVTLTVEASRVSGKVSLLLMRQALSQEDGLTQWASLAFPQFLGSLHPISPSAYGWTVRAGRTS
jgi:hypothetical protein